MYPLFLGHLTEKVHIYRTNMKQCLIMFQKNILLRIVMDLPHHFPCFL